MMVGGTRYSVVNGEDEVVPRAKEAIADEGKREVETLEVKKGEERVRDS